MEMVPSDILKDLMNGPVRKAFGDTIPDKVTHGSQSLEVFNALYIDFMKPVTTVGE